MCSKFDQDNLTITPPIYLKNASMTSLKAVIPACRRERVKWGRWFLQIVDIHVGNFNLKLTGRWFTQIVDRDSGNLYPIYIYINCEVLRELKLKLRPT